MDGDTVYRSPRKPLFTLVLVLVCVALLLLTIDLVLAPRWSAVLKTLPSILLLLVCLMSRPGRVEVSSAGLHVVGVGGNAFRSRDLAWSSIRGIGRRDSYLPLTVTLADGTSLQLPPLARADAEGLAAEITAKRGDRIEG